MLIRCDNLIVRGPTVQIWAQNSAILLSNNFLIVCHSSIGNMGSLGLSTCVYANMQGCQAPKTTLPTCLITNWSQNTFRIEGKLFPYSGSYAGRRMNL